jgi:rhamnulokinase
VRNPGFAANGPIDVTLMNNPSPDVYVAVDLGAGSGRVMLGLLGSAGESLHEVHRFHYAPRYCNGHLRWNFVALLDGVSTGLQRAARAAVKRGAHLTSIGVDSWGVDYGLLDADGRLLDDPISYRDERTRGMIDRVSAAVPRDQLFARTGIQILPFNTLYQLAAHVAEGLPPDAARLLLIPDLCHHYLCDTDCTERTNASTTQLLRVDEGCWDDDLFKALNLPRDLMPDVVAAGTVLGTLRPEHQHELGVGPMAVIAPATHDTASAVAGTPLRRKWAYISSGTWSLVGVERDRPLLTSAAAHANVTNEAGVGGTFRVLKNVAGLWLFDECRREWDANGRAVDYPTLLSRIEALQGCAGVVFPDDPGFFKPSSMVAAIRARLIETGQPALSDPVALSKVIFDSLALRYASVISTIETLTGESIEGIHIVGGGSRNRYLNQATADATGRPVLAGPAEAAAYGNVLVQAIGMGRVASLAEGRALIAAHAPTATFVPRAQAAWHEAAARYQDVEAKK